MTNALFQGGGQRDRVLTLAEVPPPTRSPTSPSHWVDNVGWGDFGVYGGTTPTPRIDKLRSEGILNVGFPDQRPSTVTRWRSMVSVFARPRR